MSRMKFLPITESLFTDWLFNAPTPAQILSKLNAMESDLIETRKALKMLYQWLQAEVEHFEAAAPDDEIVAAVEAAIKKAEEVEP
jgi:predicted aspartyl protease